MSKDSNQNCRKSPFSEWICKEFSLDNCPSKYIFKKFMEIIFFSALMIIFVRTQTLQKSPENGTIFFEPFDGESKNDSWIQSKARSINGTFSIKNSEFPVSLKNEKMLFMETTAGLYAYSKKLQKPLNITNETFILQYEVKFTADFDCGEAFLKLYGDENFNPEKLQNNTEYSILFGPSKCGSYDAVDLIFKIPKKEKRARTVYKKAQLKHPPKTADDILNHLYTLVIRTDYSFEIKIDGETVTKGSLYNDFEPPIIEPEMIDDKDNPICDENESYSNLDDGIIIDERFKDPPEGWLLNEPPFIENTNSKKPDDWDEAVLGEWVYPLIPNPKCLNVPGCGEYHPPEIIDPNYKEKPAPESLNQCHYPKKKNPYYAGGENPLQSLMINGIGLQMSTIQNGTGFSNILISNDEQSVNKWNKCFFAQKQKLQFGSLWKFVEDSYQISYTVTILNFTLYAFDVIAIVIIMLLPLAIFLLFDYIFMVFT